jgi:hypothetical protein
VCQRRIDGIWKYEVGGTVFDFEAVGGMQFLLIINDQLTIIIF